MTVYEIKVWDHFNARFVDQYTALFADLRKAIAYCDPFMASLMGARAYYGFDKQGVGDTENAVEFRDAGCEYIVLIDATEYAVRMYPREVR